mmetsp:Transcript_25025/g.94577  ORF Transcript_25025/g.94577 Transcript_25025/m.94577 type:complete len:209 (+) Transcript_25025:1209-1835(+)
MSLLPRRWRPCGRGAMLPARRASAPPRTRPRRRPRCCRRRTARPPRARVAWLRALPPPGQSASPWGRTRRPRASASAASGSAARKGLWTRQDASRGVAPERRHPRRRAQRDATHRLQACPGRTRAGRGGGACPAGARLLCSSPPVRAWRRRRTRASRHPRLPRQSSCLWATTLAEAGGRSATGRPRLRPATRCAGPQPPSRPPRQRSR